jgi:hypothetical protein
MNKNVYSRIISSVLKLSYIRDGWVRIAAISSTEVMSLHIHDKCLLFTMYNNEENIYCE